MHIVLVHVHVKPGAAAAFEAASAENAAASRLEPGIARFDVLRQRDDPAAEPRSGVAWENVSPADTDW